jgi:hypothetical protein
MIALEKKRNHSVKNETQPHYVSLPFELDDEVTWRGVKGCQIEGLITL